MIGTEPVLGSLLSVLLLLFLLLLFLPVRFFCFVFVLFCFGPSVPFPRRKRFMYKRVTKAIEREFLFGM